MTIQELENKYYFHDSSITNIDYSKEQEKLDILIVFCYWAQEWYKEGDPELMDIKLSFKGIKDYDGIVGNINYFSILDGDIQNDKYHLLIEDGFHQEYFEYYLEPSSAEVEILRTYNE